MSTDTACSSSLVSAHQGHKGLLARETVAAVAGGVNTMLLPITTTSISGLGALSPTARCKTFDASADGYGRGEGFGVVVLAPTSTTTVQQPARSGGRSSGGALALVRGSAVNQDGRSSGLTAPNGPSQTTLVREVLTAGAQLAPAQVTYVATHGTGKCSAVPLDAPVAASAPLIMCHLSNLSSCRSHAAGTPLGDPIEVNALGQALRPTRGAVARGPLALGSVKSCYGHTEGAAGLTGIFLAAETLRQHSHPAVLNLRSVTPYVEAALSDWRKAGVAASAPRQSSPGASWQPAAAAGASSFGMSGTNAHLMLSVPSPRAHADLASAPWQRMR